MTTIYRPIVTPAFLLADCVWDQNSRVYATDRQKWNAMWEDRAPGDVSPDVVQAVHAARAEVLGELGGLLKRWRSSPQFVLALMLDDYLDALRASLDDPEEGAA